MTKDLAPRPYVGKDQMDSQADDTPLLTKKGWAFVTEPKQPKTEDEKKYETLESIPDDQLTVEERNWKKRYGDLRTYSQAEKDRLSKELEDTKKALQEATSRPRAPTLTEEELDTLREAHPDSYDAISAIAQKEASETKSELDKLRAEINAEKADKAREKALRVLAKLHPDWEEIHQSQEFHDWVEAQPKGIKDWVYENETDGELAAKALSIYKLEKGVKPQKGAKRDQVDASKTANLGGSVTEPKGGTRIYTRQEIQSMDMVTYDKLRDDIKKARSEGRIR